MCRARVPRDAPFFVTRPPLPCLLAAEPLSERERTPRCCCGMQRSSERQRGVQIPLSRSPVSDRRDWARECSRPAAARAVRSASKALP